MSDYLKFAIVTGIAGVTLLCSLLGIIFDVTGKDTFFAFIISAFLSILILTFGMIFMEKSK